MFFGEKGVCCIWENMGYGPADVVKCAHSKSEGDTEAMNRCHIYAWRKSIWLNMRRRDLLMRGIKCH